MVSWGADDGHSTPVSLDWVLTACEEDFWLQMLPWCHPWHWGHHVLETHCGRMWSFLRQTKHLPVLRRMAFFFHWFHILAWVRQMWLMAVAASGCEAWTSSQQCSGGWGKSPGLYWWCGVTGNSSFSGLHFFIQHHDQPISFQTLSPTLQLMMRRISWGSLYSNMEERRLSHHSEATPGAWSPIPEIRWCHTVDERP